MNKIEKQIYKDSTIIKRPMLFCLDTVIPLIIIAFLLKPLNALNPNIAERINQPKS